MMKTRFIAVNLNDDVSVYYGKNLKQLLNRLSDHDENVSEFSFFEVGEKLTLALVTYD